MSSESMTFPNTFKEFIDEYSFKDKEEIYTNGSELIQVFRVMQGYEHFIADHDKQIRDDVIGEFEDWLFDQDEIFFLYEAITIIRKKLEELKEQKNDQRKSY